MSYRILIDTNVFLRFYDTKDNQFKLLLTFISRISEKIFVTEQIRNELLRNKLEVAIASFKNLENNFKVKGAELPSQFIDQNLQEWNKNIAELGVLHEEQKGLISKILHQISDGSDSVSTALDSVLAKAVKHSEEEFKAAERRKNLGIPPGKKGDPIGDELTWTQFISSLNSGEKVIIVSYDGDYSKEYNGDIFLNPVLFADLLSYGIKKEEIFVFRKLIDFYKEFKSLLNGDLEIPENLTDKISNEESQPIGLLAQYADYVSASNVTSAAAGPVNDVAFLVRPSGGMPYR